MMFKCSRSQCGERSNLTENNDCNWRPVNVVDECIVCDYLQSSQKVVPKGICSKMLSKFLILINQFSRVKIK